MQTKAASALLVCICRHTKWGPAHPWSNLRPLRVRMQLPAQAASSWRQMPTCISKCRISYRAGRCGGIRRLLWSFRAGTRLTCLKLHVVWIVQSCPTTITKFASICFAISQTLATWHTQQHTRMARSFKHLWLEEELADVDVLLSLEATADQPCSAAKTSSTQSPPQHQPHVACTGEEQQWLLCAVARAKQGSAGLILWTRPLVLP